MAIRAQPVKPLFQRMSRIVRELTDATGKIGAAAHRGRGDRGRPHRHRAPRRSAHPHDPQRRRSRRRAAGESARRPANRSQGEVKLSAAHRSGRIVIEVSDDGGRHRPAARPRDRDQEGADRGRRAAHATATSTISCSFPASRLRRAVSNISGRGVGMDVVKRSIQALGGRISIASRPGLGLDLLDEPAADARGARRHGGQGGRPDARRAADGDRRDAEAEGAATCTRSASTRGSSPIAAASRR